jgi:hypothetical protein
MDVRLGDLTLKVRPTPSTAVGLPNRVKRAGEGAGLQIFVKADVLAFLCERIMAERREKKLESTGLSLTSTTKRQTLRTVLPALTSQPKESAGEPVTKGEPLNHFRRIPRKLRPRAGRAARKELTKRRIFRTESGAGKQRCPVRFLQELSYDTMDLVRRRLSHHLPECRPARFWKDQTRCH